MSVIAYHTVLPLSHRAIIGQYQQGNQTIEVLSCRNPRDTKERHAIFWGNSNLGENLVRRHTHHRETNIIIGCTFKKLFGLEQNSDFD